MSMGQIHISETDEWIFPIENFMELSRILVMQWHGHLPVWACPWASYQIRKIAGCACTGNAGNVFPRRRFQRKPLVSDPGMHHGTCVTHVPWCMSGSLTCGDGENVPGACVPAILRIWQEVHGSNTGLNLGFHPPSERCYKIMLSLIGWGQT